MNKKLSSFMLTIIFLISVAITMLLLFLDGEFTAVNYKLIFKYW